MDRAHLSAGLVVKMHEHVDDEIVSYLRTGSLTHTDSDGNSETVTPTRLMVMNAGAGFSHEERMPEGEDIHMLQIFLRPEAPGLEPAVQFAELDEAARSDGWRAIVAPRGAGGEAPATVRTEAWIHDAHVAAGASIALPERDGVDRWLYVFDGRVGLPDGRMLRAGEALAAPAGQPLESVRADRDSDLVLFELGADARYTMAGSLSRGR